MNPIKAGGLNRCIAQEKAIENRYWIEINVHNPIFEARLIGCSGGLKKMPKKWSKTVINIVLF